MALSPHQYCHDRQKVWLRPPAVSVMAPTVALSSGLNNPAPTSSAPYSLSVANCGFPPRNQRTSQAPARAPVESARKNPRAMPGDVPLRESNNRVAGSAASTNQGHERVSTSNRTPTNKPPGSQKLT